MPSTKDHPLTGVFAELHETWLAPNGVIGWMPESATVTVDTAAGTVTWPQWRHLSEASGPWDKDVMVESDEWTDEQRRTRDGGLEPVVDNRTTPLAVPVNERVRELCRAAGLNLVER